MSRDARLSDRIKQLSFDPSTGAFSLDSVATGFSPFSDFYEVGDVVFYAATDGTRYEVGSGEYTGSTLTRYPLRSNQISSGPYYVDAPSARESDAGVTGVWHPLYLTKSAASGLRGFNVAGGAVSPASGVHEHTFSGYPGVTFYMPNMEVAGHAQASSVTKSGENYASSGAPVSFQGVTEVFVTYPGKYSVFSAGGISGFNEPKSKGVAFWGNEQTLDYDSNIVWDTGVDGLGISQPSPEHPIDVGGLTSYSQVRASGFIGGGSGVQFSGGQALPQSALKTASGGRQLEPFYRNELDAQTKSDQIFSLSGLVDERLLLQTQEKGMVFSGPPSGCTSTCSPDHPTFRYLELEDIPDLASLYVVQNNATPYEFVPEGSIPFTTSSGTIEYSSGELVFSESNSRLAIGHKTPAAALDVKGSILASGNIDASGDITANGSLRVGGNVLVSGNLDVQGDVTYIDSTQVMVVDKQLELASMSGAALYNHGALDSGGIVLKSTDGDQFWIWSSGSIDGSMYDPAWVTDADIWTSGGAIRFNDGPTISGAYHAGSGLELHNGVAFNIGNLFQVSGNAELTSGANVLASIHQGDTLQVSGISGVHASFEKISTGSNGDAGSGVVTIDPTHMYNTLSGAIVQVSNADTQWKIHVTSGTWHGFDYDDPTFPSGHVIETVNDTLAVSGISGISLVFASGDGDGQGFFISAAPVSGYFESRINSIDTATWKVNASGGNLEHGEVASGIVLDTIAAGQAISFSGVEGLEVAYDATFNYMTFGTAPLSGYLDYRVIGSGDRVLEIASGLATVASGHAIDVSGYLESRGTWKVNASGGNLEHGEVASGILLDEITAGQAISFSGVEGLEVAYDATLNYMSFGTGPLSGYLDYRVINSGDRVLELASGIAMQASGALNSAIGGLAGGYGNWKVNASGGNLEHGEVASGIVLDEIAAGHAISFSGVEGLEVAYDATVNYMSFGAAPLSGLIVTSGERVLELASGIAMQASGALNSAIGGLAGGYGNWKVNASGGNLEHGEVASGIVLDEISAGNAISFSGVEGLEVAYDATVNYMSFGAAPLSGYLDYRVIGSGDRVLEIASGLATVASGHAIDVSGYAEARLSALGTWKVNASGGNLEHPYVSGVPSGIGLDEITAGQAISFSGVDGLEVAYDATNNYMSFGAAPLSGYTEARFSGLGDTFTWKVNASGGNLEHGEVASGIVLDEITTGQAISFSGIEGLEVAYDSTVNYMSFGAAPLSGYLDYRVIGSGNRALEVASGLATVASGHAIAVSGYALDVATSASGHAIDVSGYALGLVAKYGSGLLKQDNVVDFRPDGSGALKHLGFYRGVRIGDGAGVGISGNPITGEDSGHEGGIAVGSVFIGNNAGFGSINPFPTSGIFIGQLAGAFGSGNQDSVFIGRSAGYNSIGNSGSDPSGYMHDNIGVGRNAARALFASNNSTFIGSEAGINAKDFQSTIVLGTRAADNVQGAYDSMFIGTNAGVGSSGAQGSVFIGNTAGSGVTDSLQSVMIGDHAGTGAFQIEDSFIAGKLAGSNSYAISGTTFIGESAGKGASGVEHSVAIGTQAFVGSISGLYSVAIGPYAGFYSSGVTSVVAIGEDAALKSSGNTDCNFIGRSAGQAAGIMSLPNENIDAIGQQAFQAASGCGNSQFFGRQAGFSAIDIRDSFIAGDLAGSFTTDIHASMLVGQQSAFYRSGIQDSVILGRQAAAGFYGYGDSNTHLDDSVLIGSYAGYLSSGVDHVVSIGHQSLMYNGNYAGVAHHKISDGIFIGRQAGYSTSAGTQGRYPGDHNIIITNYEANAASELRQWAGEGTDYIINIGHLIHGYSQTSASPARFLQVGDAPTSLAQLQEATLNVKPDSSATSTLYLRRAAGQSADMLKAESSWDDQIILTEQGVLQIPVATGLGTAGNYSTMKLTGSNATVNNSPGSIVLFDDGSTELLLICGADGTWLKLPDELEPA